MTQDAKCPGHLDFDRLVSAPRFETYRNYLTHNPDVLADRDLELAAKRLYLWDASVAASLWPSVALAEVILRNAMNDVICGHFGVEREDGWHPLALGPTPRIHLLDDHRRELERDVDRLARRLDRPPTGDEVVGGVSLGIWGILLDRGDMDDPLRHYEVTIWRAYLSNAFPNFRGKRRALRETLRQVSKLRNRMAHHEPLLRRSVRSDIETIARLVSYIDLDASDYIIDREGASCVYDQRGDYLDGECYL